MGRSSEGKLWLPALLLRIAFGVPVLVLAGFIIASFVHPGYSHNPHAGMELWGKGCIAAVIVFVPLVVLAVVISTVCLVKSRTPGGSKPRPASDGPAEDQPENPVSPSPGIERARDD